MTTSPETRAQAETSPGRGDPLARRLYALLRDRPDADRRLVFETLAERVGGGEAGGLGESQRLAVDALEACRAAHGGELPTVASYRAWRELSGGGLAPTVGRLQGLFGSWGEALAAMPSAPRFDPTAGRLVGRGRRIGRDDALRALREFAASLPPDAQPTVVRYRAWAAGRPPGAARVPASGRTHVKIFGSWLGALAAAGVRYPPRAREAPRRERRGFEPADAVAALRRFWGDSGPPATSPRYERWALGRFGPGERVPSPATITALMGGWRVAVVEALGAGATGPSRGPSYPRRELVAALRECREQLGRPPSVAGYSAWRARQAARRPSARTIAVWLGAGAWPAALDAAQREEHEAGGA